MRDEGDRLDEAIEIGRRSGARVQISHCKAFGPRTGGRARCYSTSSMTPAGGGSFHL
jgi:hypothetical protein